MTLIICILNGLCWSLFDITRKLSLQYLSPKILLSLFMIIQFFFFFSWILIEQSFEIQKSYILPGLILILISVFSALFFLKSLLISDLSLTIPLLSLTPVFSSFFSYFIINEALESTEYFGILIIVLGALVLYAERLQIRSIFNSFRIIKMGWMRVMF